MILPYLLAAFSVFNAFAQPTPATKPTGSTLVTLQLITEQATWKPGDKSAIGVHFKLTPDWHLYWNGINDSGMPPHIELSGPTNFEIGPAQWPAPIRHRGEGNITDHIYESDVTIIYPITVPADAKDSAAFTVKSKWLVCKDVCLPGDGAASLTVPIAAESAKPTADAPKFAAARARHPQPYTATNKLVEVKLDKNVLRVSPKEGADISSLAFFPADGCSDPVDIGEDGAATGTGTNPPKLAVRLTPNERQSSPLALGIVEIQSKGSATWFLIDELGTKTPAKSPTPVGPGTAKPAPHIPTPPK